MRIDSVMYPQLGDIVIETIDGQQVPVKFVRHKHKTTNSFVCDLCFYRSFPSKELKGNTACRRPTTVCRTGKNMVGITTRWEAMKPTVSPNGGDV